MTPWYAPLARAIPALVLAVVIAFSADHSAPLGYLSLGIFAVISGAAIGFFAARSKGGTVRTVQLVQGAITVIAGIVSLVMINGGLPFLLFLLSTFAAVTGFLELYLGIRGRGKDRLARDWTFIGALTALLAIVVLVIPPDFVQSFTGPDEVGRELTASIIVVGVLGAYFAIFGVYLVIAALSIKWAPEPAAAVLESR